MAPVQAGRRASGTFSPLALRALRLACLRIRTAPAHDRISVFDACRAAMEVIAPVDSFYVAMVRASSRHLLHPYTYDHGRPEPVNVEAYGERGLTARMLTTQRTYRYREDNGRLVHAGAAFGETEEHSRDAIVSPFLATSPSTGSTPEQRVVGFMAVLSTTPDVFTDEHVAALERLAHSVSVRWEQDAAHDDADEAPFPVLVPGQAPSTWDVVNYAGGALRRLNDDMQNLAVDHPELSRELLAIAARSERYHNGLRRMLSTSERLVDPFVDLTPREREIARLLVETPAASNQALAVRLGITEATAKTHMSRLLAKLGLRQRSEIQWLVEGPFGTSQTR